MQVVGNIPDSDETIVVNELKELIQHKKRYLLTDLPFIDVNYYFLVKNITKLESGKIMINEALKIIETTESKLEQISCESGVQIYTKFMDVFNRNPDLNTLKSVNCILNGEKDRNLPDRVTIPNMIYLQKSILVSVDVERTFSRYRSLLRDDRKSFLYHNFKKHLIINCNRSINGYENI